MKFLILIWWSQSSAPRWWCWSRPPSVSCFEGEVGKSIALLKIMGKNNGKHMKTYEKTPKLGRIYMNFIVYFIYYLCFFFLGGGITPFPKSMHSVMEWMEFFLKCFVERSTFNPGICFGSKKLLVFGAMFRISIALHSLWLLGCWFRANSLSTLATRRITFSNCHYV